MLIGRLLMTGVRIVNKWYDLTFLCMGIVKTPWYAWIAKKCIFWEFWLTLNNPGPPGGRTGLGSGNTNPVANSTALLQKDKAAHRIDHSSLPEGLCEFSALLTAVFGWHVCVSEQTIWADHNLIINGSYDGMDKNTKFKGSIVSRWQI